MCILFNKIFFYSYFLVKLAFIDIHKREQNALHASADVIS